MEIKMLIYIDFLYKISLFIIYPKGMTSKPINPSATANEVIK